MNRVEIEFDCIPLRTISRLDIPLDASPGYIQKCKAIKRAIEVHGSHNTYFLHNASCTYYLTNHSEVGKIKFSWEGTVSTDIKDRHCVSVSLSIQLESETCDWLTEPIVQWFSKTVEQSVKHEFNRYIEAGDLSKTENRIRELQEKQETDGGYLGMYL
ncbi:MAG: hypothetical protein VX438_08585 [Planctomycetota bacterium]|jgi:hypothetical protein|nr:hypothetical protein [Planctomycetota bacterium]